MEKLTPITIFNLLVTVVNYGIPKAKYKAIWIAMQQEIEDWF